MKKTLLSIATISMLVACQKGTISGEVINPFTNKPIAKARLQVLGTPNITQSDEQGKFTFPKEIALKEYGVRAGKGKHSTSKTDVVLDEKNPNATIKVYVYPKQGLKPGLYTPSDTAANKIKNQWVGYDQKCENGILGYKLKEKQGKKVVSLPNAASTTSQINAFLYSAATSTAPIHASVFPATIDKVSKFSCKGFDKDRKGLFGDSSKGTQISSTYTSDNLYNIKGQLPKGKQFLHLTQSGKTLATYYFDVK